MYESFYRLNDRPFTASPQPDRYFPARTCEAARRNLARAIERCEGTGLLIGPTGSGKTLVLQMLAREFRERFSVVLLANGRIGSRRTLLQAILFELGLPYRDMDEGELRLSLIDHLEPNADCPLGLLLLIDEAHALPLRLIDELRMITNVVRGGQPRVRLVLAGNTALEERLTHPRLESFCQRIACRCYLEPLDYDETVAYVQAQLRSCGGGNPLDSGALGAVYRASGGVPRLINQICDHALLLGFSAGRTTIDAAGIEEAWADLQQLPLPIGESRNRAGRADEGDVIEFGELDDAPLLEAAEHAAPADEHGGEDETTRRVERVERAWDELEETLVLMEATAEEHHESAAGALRPNPFAEPFADEEVIFDRYGSAEPPWRSSALVRTAEGRLLARLVETLPDKCARPRLSIAGGVAVDERPLEPDPLANYAGQGLRHGEFDGPETDDELSPADDPLLPEEPWTIAAPRPGLHEQCGGSGAAELVPPWQDDQTQQELSPTEPQTDDQLIVVEEDPAGGTIDEPTAEVCRLEYGQLFARLRNG